MQELSRNVFYDSASAHKWSDLNETVFLERVISGLRTSMGDAFLKYSFFILSAKSGDVWPESASNSSPYKVLIFVSDESSSIPTALQPHYFAIFKGYLPSEMPGSNIFPFNVGYVRDVPTYPLKPVEDRAINVFFSGNLSASRFPLYRALHPVYRRLPRITVRGALSLSRRGYGRRLMPDDLSRALPRSVVRFTRGFQRGLSRAEYGKSLADSRIVLCPRGASSPETFRHLEAMRAGAVLVSERLPATHFYRGAPIVTVDNWEAGIDTVRQLLEDETTLRELQRATIRWWRDVCSEAATGKYMHDRLTELAAASSNPDSAVRGSA
jgi:hypothetical protein